MDVRPVSAAFAFVDLCGFVPLTERRGERYAAHVIDHLDLTLRTACLQRGVEVARRLGAGALLIGFDVEALGHAVLDARDVMAREGPLALRGGIAEGRASRIGGSDYVGPAPAFAARLMQRARPHQVLTTDRAAGALRDLVTVRPCAGLPVPGSGGTIAVCELVGAPRSVLVGAARGASASVVARRADLNHPHDDPRLRR